MTTNSKGEALMESTQITKKDFWKVFLPLLHAGFRMEL